MRISDWSSDVCSSDLLDEGERLHEIVVAALAQAADPFVERRQRRQDQNRDTHAGGPRRLQHRQAVESGQHSVEHDRVVYLAGRQENPLATRSEECTVGKEWVYTFRTTRSAAPQPK